MKAEYKTRWLEALRSGRYTQGRGVLRTHKNEYCCLGVLCDIVDPTHWESRKSIYDSYTYDDCKCQLPNELEEFMEMNINQSELIHLNDTKRQSFAEIADFIEKNA